MNEIRKLLRNHSIVDLYLHDDKERMCIVIGGTDYMVSVAAFETYGDCCSTSWIEHVANPEACRMSRFIDWVEVDISPQKIADLSGADVVAYNNGELKFYFYRLITDKGETVIEMRNSSNGYYGGSLDLKVIVPFLDWHGHEDPKWRCLSNPPQNQAAWRGSDAYNGR